MVQSSSWSRPLLGTLPLTAGAGQENAAANKTFEGGVILPVVMIIAASRSVSQRMDSVVLESCRDSGVPRSSALFDGTLSPWLVTGAPPPVSDMYHNSATVVF